MLALLALASFEAVQPLSQAARELAATLAAGQRLLELTDREPAIVDPRRPAPLPAEPFAVALEGVRARLRPSEPPVLDGFDLRLEPGSRVALVGPSGAGKTTVVNLLVRFLDPEAGRVTLGGRDLREYRQEDVRRAIAVAGQDSHLFSTTIRENVRLGAAGRERRRDRGRAPAGADPRLGAQPPGRLGHARRRGGTRALGRTAAAPRRRARAPRGCAGARARRADRAPRPATAERLIDDVLDAAADRSVLLITHRPEGLDRMDEIVTVSRVPLNSTKRGDER